MNDRKYNLLMIEYLKTIDKKDVYMTLAHQLCEDIDEYRELYESHKSSDNYSNAKLRLDYQRLRRAIRDYNEINNQIRKLTDEITDLGKQISLVNMNSKKVCFLIPGTIPFETMLTNCIQKELQAQ